MRTIAVCLVAFASLAAPALAQNRSTNQLTIYVVDVEGGNATLFVTPSGETVLIDTGNGGAQAARDAGRIMEAAKDAGVTKIDHLIITHWHGDHFGGLGDLARQIPIAHYYDHGANVQVTPATDEFFKTVACDITARWMNYIGAQPRRNLPDTWAKQIGLSRMPPVFGCIAKKRLRARCSRVETRCRRHTPRIQAVHRRRSRRPSRWLRGAALHGPPLGSLRLLLLQRVQSPVTCL